jgi:hypothetical protein
VKEATSSSLVRPSPPVQILNHFPIAMLSRLFSLLLVGCWMALFAVPSATAQSSNLDTVEGPGTGEKTTLTITPHTLTEEVSARALGVKSPSGTRWALTLIGISPADSIELILEGEALPIKDISRPEEGEVGPTRVYLSQQTFLTVADRSDVRLRIGDATTQLPDQMRTEMRQIFEKVV